LDGSGGFYQSAGAGGYSMTAGGTTGVGGSVGSGSTLGSGTSGVPFLPIGGAMNDKPDSSCGAVVEKPEQIIHYTDASVTDTITTFTPVALFIMQDRTGSMVSGVPSGCACSWQNSSDALAAFVRDPASANLDVGLGFFGGGDKTACDGSDCGQAVVPIAPIAQSGPQITSAMGANAPNPLHITPLECGGDVIIVSRLPIHVPAGEKCVAVPD
jgi:hypothetical protein